MEIFLNTVQNWFYKDSHQKYNPKSSSKIISLNSRQPQSCLSVFAMVVVYDSDFRYVCWRAFILITKGNDNYCKNPYLYRVSTKSAWKKWHKTKDYSKEEKPKKGNTQPIESLYLNWLNTKTHWTPCMYRVSHIETCFLNWLWGVEGPIILLNYCA